MVYVARDHTDAEAARALERTVYGGDAEANDRADRAFGALLGYPACCVEAFVAGHQSWKKGRDPVLTETAYFALEALRRSERLDGRLNFVGADEVASFLRHDACRFDCPASIAIHERLEADLASSNPRLLAKHRRARVDTLLLWADGTVVHLEGERDGNRLHRPRVRSIEGGSVRLARSRAAAARIAPQLAAGVTLVGAGLRGPGGVRMLGAGETELVLHGVPVHPDFPRLLFFD